MSYTPDVSMFPYFKKSSIDWKKMYQKTFAQKKALKKENEELNEVNEQLEAEAERTGELESIVWLDFYGEKEVIDDIKAYRFRDDIIALKARVAFLEQLTEGIMNEEGTGHIQGTNAYEKFCQAMCELNHDEKLITELEQKEEENKEYKEYYDKWSPILTDIDGDEFCDLLSDYGWEYNDEDELVNICVDYENDEVDYYIDAGRKVVLKDVRIVKRQD